MCTYETVRYRKVISNWEPKIESEEETHDVYKSLYCEYSKKGGELISNTLSKS
jgi:hypothetical protein